MLRLAFLTALTSFLLQPSSASANSCILGEPVVDVAALPVGCATTVHTSQSFSYPLEAPIARATRILAGGAVETVDVTGSIQRSTTTLPIDEYYYETPTTCELLLRSRLETFDTVTIELTGVMAGDRIDILDGGSTRARLGIVAAGPCPGPDAKTLSCAEGIQSCDDDNENDPGDGVPSNRDLDDDGGCSVGGSRSLGILLGLVLIVLRRRRRA